MPALSPSYGLAPIVLHGNGANWPGLLLHSRHLAWPFDEWQQTLPGPAELATVADRAGLHRVDDLFADHLEDARSVWAFHLAALNSRVMLSGPDGEVVFGRDPHISDLWWKTAVETGGTCRMLIAACVALDPENPKLDPLIQAAAGGRVFGATIPVRFFPEQS